MANENRVQIIITTDSTGAVTGIRGVEEETKRSVSEMEKYWLRLGTAIAAAFSVYKAADIIRDSTMIASRVETLGVVMETVGRNAGYSKQEVEAYSESVKQMGITTQASHQTVIRMMQAQMDLNQASNLARVAQDAAVIGNINSSEALERMIQGIQRGETEIMKTIGLNVSFENSYKVLAAQLGKNTDQLTEAEKVQARTNVTLEAGARIAGTYEAAMGTVGKQLLSLDRYVEEVELKLGKLFTPTLSVAIQIATQALQDLNKQFDEFNESGEQASWAYGLAEGMKALAVYTIGVAAAFDIAGTAMGEFFAKVAERGKKMITSPVQYFMNIFNDETGTPGYDQTAATLDKYAALIDKIWKIGAGGGTSNTETSSAIAAVGTAAGMTAAEIKKLTDAFKELADWQKDMYRMAEEELAYFTAMQGTELDKQIAQIDAAAAKIGANLGKLGLDAEEFETRWAEIARVSEIVKQTARDESHNKLIQQLKEQGEKYQALFDQQRQQQITGYNDIWSNTMNTINQSGDYATGVGMMATNMKGITDVVTGQDKYTLEYERAREHYNQMRELYQQNLDDYGGSEAAGYELNEAYQNMIIANEQRTASMRAQITQGMFGMMAGAALTFYNATGQQSQAAFRLYQAMAIAETTISTIMAAQDAYAWGMKYGGPFAPFVAAAAAGVAIAAGMARVAAISSQKMATASPATGISAGGGYTYTQSTEPSYQTEQKTETRPVEVKIYVQGNIIDQDKFARELIPSITKALGDRAA